MSGSLFSQSWYRVAELKPRLRGHARFHRHLYRGQVWHVIQDSAGGRYHRFSPEAYAVIGLMDGRRTLREIWEAACEQLGDDAPSQDEVIQLLGQLHGADLLQVQRLPAMGELGRRRARGRRSRWVQQFRSPLSIRFPLFDPDRLLTASLPLVRPLFGRFGWLIWWLAAGAALSLLSVHWESLGESVADSVFSAENLLLMGLIYPFVKGLHELGHAYAVKRWGGEVHETGIMFLVLMPVPYVEASESAVFRDKGRRMAVAGAGILVELFLGAVATLVWAAVEPGTVRAVAFNVMLIAGLSSLLINGNPLLRFDGYYVLADWLEIPNLAQRSNRYIGYLAKRYLLGIGEVRSPVSASGESGWFLFYGVASFLYRLFILVTIILFVSEQFFTLGLLLAAWAVVGTQLLPLSRNLARLGKDPQVREKRRRLTAVTLAGAGLLVALIALIPFPHMTVAEGVVWVPEGARIRAATDGFVTGVLTPSGDEVGSGDPLVGTDSPELTAELKVIEARLQEAEARYRASFDNRIQAELVREEVQLLRQEAARQRQRVEKLLILSPGEGRLVIPGWENLPGRFVRRGEQLGYVLDAAGTRVRAVVTQADLDDVRQRTRGLEARFAADLSRSYPGRVIHWVPAATRELPSVALSLEGGGDIALDPRAGGRPESYEPLFQLEMELESVSLPRVGERVHLRFLHHPEPLIFRWYRALRRQLLNRFDV